MELVSIILILYSKVIYVQTISPLDHLPPSSSRTCSPHDIVNYSLLLPQVQTMIQIS